jgi:hypothetical protein
MEPASSLEELGRVSVGQRAGHRDQRGSVKQSLAVVSLDRGIALVAGRPIALGGIGPANQSRAAEVASHECECYRTCVRSGNGPLEASTQLRDQDQLGSRQLFEPRRFAVDYASPSMQSWIVPMVWGGNAGRSAETEPPLIRAGIETIRSPFALRISTHAERGIAPDLSMRAVSWIGRSSRSSRP